MSQFRKRPVVIEAFQMTEARRNDNAEWPHWLNDAWNKEPGEPGAFFIDRPIGEPERLLIHTMEGAHIVTFGDYIIQGVRGELYPCKPDIFAATYEAVSPTVATPGSGTP